MVDLAPKFLCDAMLARLARWLRAAGHDAELAMPSEDDAAILARAAADHRLVVTRDRGMVGRRQALGRVLLLEGPSLDGWMAQLRPVLPAGLLHRPFSRCLLCNSPLQQPSAKALADLPEAVHDKAPQALWCGTCARLYWPGSHTRRMMARLELWHQRGGGS